MEELQLRTLALGSRSDQVVSPFNKLVDDSPSKVHHGHGPSSATHTPITTGIKLVYGLGFCVETMFDVASDTLLAKFYSGACIHRLWACTRTLS